MGNMKYSTLAKYCIMLFCGEKFRDLTHFLSFPRKLLQLPVTLPISGMLDSNIHGKTYTVTKQFAKIMKLLPQNKAILWRPRITRILRQSRDASFS